MVKITTKVGTIILIAQVCAMMIALQSATEQDYASIKAEEILNTAIVSQTYLLNASLNIQTNIFSGINAILTNITTNESLKGNINAAYTGVINETQNRIAKSNQFLKEERALVSKWHFRFNNSKNWSFYTLLAHFVVIVIIIIVFFVLPSEDFTCIFKDRKRRE